VLTVAKIENLKINDIDDIGKDFATRKTIVNWLEIKNEKWEEQIKEVLTWVEMYDLKIITVDATGKGDPISERLEKALEFTDCKIIPVVFSLKTKHEMAVLFYQELRQHRILVPGHQSAEKSRRVKAFKLQILTCEKVYKNKFMQLVHADVKNARDDYVDSLLLLCYGVEQYQAPFIRTDQNVFFEEEGKHSSRYSQRLNRIRRKSSAKWRKSGEITKLK
jgi:phage FluMu gp28-like protein